MIHVQEEWLDVEQAAVWLKLPVLVVSQAVATGQIPAIRLGDHIRISRSALLAAAGQSTSLSAPTEAFAETSLQAQPALQHHGVPTPKGLIWEAEPEAGEGFTYHWPRPADDPEDDGGEEYTSVWNAAIALHGHIIPVRVGESVRNDRGRLTVWFGHYPVAEFAATEDGTCWASLIKPDSRKVLKPGEPIPSLYWGARVEPYRLVTGLTGSGVPNGMCVVIDRDDLRSAVHHATARWLRRQNLPVEVSA